MAIRIALASDWHLGVTSHAACFNTIASLKHEVFDLFVYAGDFSGEQKSSAAVGVLANSINKEIKQPKICVLGNHDYWHGPKGSEKIFETNYKEVLASLKQTNFFVLNTEGPFRINGYTFVGHTCWYGHPKPNTNDMYHIHYSHKTMSHKAYEELDLNLQKLTDKDEFRIFVSHFPVIELKDSYDTNWGGNPHYGELLLHQYGFQIFMDGHFHHRINTGTHFNCGSDYYAPTYMMVNL